MTLWKNFYGYLQELPGKEYVEAALWGIQIAGGPVNILKNIVGGALLGQVTGPLAESLVTNNLFQNVSSGDLKRILSQYPELEEHFAQAKDAVQFGLDLAICVGVGSLSKKIVGRPSSGGGSFAQLVDISKVDVIRKEIVKDFGKELRIPNNDLTPTLERIKKGEKHPHPRDGTTYRNKNNELPVQPEGYYKEYVHPTSGLLKHDPGPQRIVVGKYGEVYYTPDHYKTLIKIN